MSHDQSEQSPRIQLALSMIFLLVVLGGIVDLILDRPERFLTPHVLFEATLVALSLGAASFLARGWLRASTRVGALEREIAGREAERDAWRRRGRHAIDGLRAAIGEQFDAWELTPTEREIALRLLAGESHKRVARETRRSERTVRQHAIAIYRKAGISGRAELAGFFLGDLLGGDESEDASEDTSFGG